MYSPEIFEGELILDKYVYFILIIFLYDVNVQHGSCKQISM